MDTTTALWFRPYLFERCQSKKYCDATSDKRELSFGAPQSCVLGSTLFALYINPLLPKHLRMKECDNYADEISIITSGNTPSEAKAKA